MGFRKLNWALLAVILCAGLAAYAPAQDAPAPARAETLIENLRDKAVDVRRSAANRIRMSDSGVQQKALPVLIDLLMKEKDGQVRLAVLDTVTALAPAPRRPFRLSFTP